MEASNEKTVAPSSLWKVSHGDVVMYFSDDANAKHNYDAFARAGMHPTIDIYHWESRVKD